MDTEISFVNTHLPLPVTIKEGKVVYELKIAPASKVEIKYQINLRSTADLPKKFLARILAKRLIWRWLTIKSGTGELQTLKPITKTSTK